MVDVVSGMGVSEVSPEHVADRAPDRMSDTQRRAAVAGDVTIDWHLARTRRRLDGSTSWNCEARSEEAGPACDKPTAWIHPGNRLAGTTTPTFRGTDQDHVSYGNF